LGIKFDRDGVPVLLNGKKLSIWIIVCQGGGQTVGKTVLFAYGWQRVNKLENLRPTQKVAGLGVVEVATTFANVALKGTD
jgi:hypothetical protein